MNSAAVAVAAPGSATQRQARHARWRPAAPATADWTHVRAVGVGRSEMRVSTAHVFWPLAAGECHGYPDLVELRAQVARTLGRNRDGRALASSLIAAALLVQRSRVLERRPALTGLDLHGWAHAHHRLFAGCGLCDERLESSHVRRSTKPGCGRGRQTIHSLLRDFGGQRSAQHFSGLRSHGSATQMARLAYR